MKNKLLEILGVEKIMNAIQGLIETRVAMVKEEIEEKVANSLAKAIPILLVIFSIFLFILFGSITLGLYLSMVMDNSIAGFGIIAVLYLIVGIVLFLIRNNKSYTENFYKQVKKRR